MYNDIIIVHEVIIPSEQEWSIIDEKHQRLACVENWILTPCLKRFKKLSKPVKYALNADQIVLFESGWANMGSYESVSEIPRRFKWMEKIFGKKTKKELHSNPDEHVTWITLKNGRSIYVKETFDEIVEMLKNCKSSK